MLKLQYFGYLMQNVDSLENALMLGKIEGGGEGGNRGWDGWMTSLTQCTWVWANSGRSGRTGKPGMLQSLGSQSQTRLSDWTATTWSLNLCLLDRLIRAFGFRWDFYPWSNLDGIRAVGLCSPAGSHLCPCIEGGFLSFLRTVSDSGLVQVTLPLRVAVKTEREGPVPSAVEA